MKKGTLFKMFCGFFFTIFILPLLVSSSYGQEPVVRLGYLQSDLHQLACFVSLEKGFFKQEGVQVEIGGIFKAGPEEMSAFAAKSLDAGYVGAAPATVAVANGVAKVKIIAQVNLEGSAIVVRKGSGIKTVNDLKGKTVTVPGYAQVQDCLLRMALKKADMPLKSVHIMVLKPPEMIPSLESKQIDGFVAWEPYIAKAINKGVGEVLINSGEIWPQHPC
ncbi:MAG: ABC transporter substrate-binding protein [Desulfobacteraceae bacterium]|nr:ABC transporter substrate-binding protein [Desulfobacteraceae bacterium]